MSDQHDQEAGPTGLHGPNDGGYINSLVRAAAAKLVSASALWCVGYGYKCERMPDSHPIARALAALCDADKETARSANEAHAPSLFAPYRPSDEDIAAFEQFCNQPVHDRTSGPHGETGDCCNPGGS